MVEELNQSFELIEGQETEQEEYVMVSKDEASELKKLYNIYNCALKIVETKLFAINTECSVVLEDRNPIHSIKTRLKTLPSLIEKVKRRGLERTVDSIRQNITDIAGARVVFYNVPSLYAGAYMLLKQEDVTVVEVEDYIANPKKSGYSSLHMLIKVPVYFTESVEHVPVELQFRTISMDLWAAVDHQIKYKKDIGDENAETLEIADNELAETTRLLEEKVLKCYQIAWGKTGCDYEKLFRETFCK